MRSVIFTCAWGSPFFHAAEAKTEKTHERLLTEARKFVGRGGGDSGRRWARAAGDPAQTRNDARSEETRKPRIVTDIPLPPVPAVSAFRLTFFKTASRLILYTIDDIIGAPVRRLAV
jgi:hypothetical protein